MYSVAILGAGRIASQFDSPQDSVFLTHCHSFTAEKKFSIVGIFDVDQRKTKLAGERWGIPTYFSLEELLSLNLDVIVVCVPDTEHAPLLRKILEVCVKKPKLVLCEKPLTLSILESRELVSLYQKQNVELCLCYQRRYDASVVTLKKEVENKTWGFLLSAVMWYSKGILHNGSHGVDLFRFLFGEPHSLLVTKKRNDYCASDPTVDGVLFYPDFQITLVSGHEEKFSLFELDLLFEKKRIRFLHSGLQCEEWALKPDPVFSGYFELFSNSTEATKLSYALRAITADLAMWLERGGDYSLPISVAQTLQTQQICETLARAPIFERISIG